MPIAIQKHATSKIQDFSDLSSIDTLGFRGEALASMAAVSRLTIRTRTADSLAGTVLSVSGGGEAMLSTAGLPEGTTVKVENLFYNVPARLKFLKNPSHEMAGITNVVSKMILARPNVSFRYLSNDKIIYQSTGRGDLREALATIFGKDIYDKILPVSYADGAIHIDGYLSKPAFLYRNTGNILFYLNGRYIQSKNMQRALLRGYEERILRSLFPFSILHITLPYDLVDVNVHPNKLQVMFFQEAAILDAVTRAVSDALQKNMTPVFHVDGQAVRTSGGRTLQRNKNCEENPPCSHVSEKGIAIPSAGTAQGYFLKDLPVLNTADQLCREPSKAADSASCLMEERDSFSPPQQFQYVLEKISEQEKTDNIQGVQAEIEDVRNMVDYHIIGQVFSTYLVCECGSVLYLIDQHAAHERITYELIKKQIQEGKPLSQRLLLPVVRQLNQHDFLCLLEHFETLRDLGFDAEEFGPLTIRLSALPTQVEQAGIDALIEDVLFELKKQPDNMILLRDRIIRAACRHSIKAGDSLSDSQILSLISEIIQLNAIPTCPHGRPIAIAITKEELQKGFKRTI